MRAMRLTARRLVGMLRIVLLASCVSLLQGVAAAATYTSASIPFDWVDPSSHTKIGHNTAPYKFNQASGCATKPPILDDTLSDLIPIGFTFVFGATSHTSVRVQTNGRLQFNNTLCGAGTQSLGPPQTYPYGYPNVLVNNTMKVFGVDLDPTNLVDKANYPSAARKTNCLSIATCFISVATVGAAPNRRFVVTWNNVPEWVSATTTSGSFNVQIVLNENGTFVYQYGNITHGGSGSAQIGWQLGVADFDVLTFGASSEPPPSTAILFYKATGAPLAEYRFEEGAWSPGVAGQVVDASGNGRGGMALNTVQPTGAGRVCRGAVVAADSSVSGVQAVRSGVRFSDPGVNMQGQGTVMFWYKSTAAWSGAGAQAAQLLDATQVAGQWFSLTRTPSGTLHFEVTDSTGVVRSTGTAVQPVGANTWVHIAITWNFNALAAANSDTMAIMVDGGSPSTSAFTTTGSLSATLDFLHAGDNPSGLVGSQGSVNSAAGVIDELRIYNVALNRGQVLGELAVTRACGSFAIDHLELRHGSWSGLACAPGSLTVVACANAACTSLYTQGLIATLGSTGAATVWDPGAGGATVIIGNGQSSVTRNFFTAAGSATFSVTGTGVPVMESRPMQCNGPAGSCVWNSANGGLLMSIAGGGTIIGAKPVPVTVQAVQSSGPTPGAACVPAQGIAGAGLKVWSAPVDPAAFAATRVSASVTVGGTPSVASAAAASYASTAAAMPAVDNVLGLAFDANASGTLWLKHMDVGQFNLFARLDRPASAAAPALSLTGNATATSLPLGYGIAVAGVSAPPSVQGACASGPSATCDTLAGASPSVGAAGQSFPITVHAALWTSDGDTDLSDNPVAPNYAGSVSLAPSLVAPQGGSAGALALTSATLAAGAQNLAGQSWTQSGALRISASGTYLLNTLSGQSAVMGRFTPRNFATSVVTQGCGSFTYSGQPISAVLVRAMDGAAVPASTPNFSGAFARAVTLGDGNGNAVGSLSSNLVAAAAFSGGAATAAPVFTFSDARTAPISLVLRASDGEISSSGATEGVAAVRSGRLAMQNTYGSELLDLPVPLAVEYWNGTSFVTNTADSCTSLPVTSIAMGNFLGQLEACETGPLVAGSLVMVAGKLLAPGLSLRKPGVGNSGSVDLTINTGTVASGNTCVGSTSSAAQPAAIPWLGVQPSARATFGIYRSPIIYRRENY